MDQIVRRQNEFAAYHFQCRVCKKLYYGQFRILYDCEDAEIGFFITEYDGKSYLLSDFWKMRHCCGQRLRMRRVSSTYDEDTACGRECYNARTQVCKCRCGGLLHGVNLPQYRELPD